MMINHRITKGISKIYTKKTNTGDAYSASNSGALDYLVSTPTLMLMTIDAATDMLDPLLPSGYITVGKKIELIHEHPSLVGETISLKLEVEKVEGHMITLDIEVKDSKGIVCTGKYQRAVIGKERLLDIAYQRAPGLI